MTDQLQGRIRKFSDRYQMRGGPNLEYFPMGEEWSPDPSARVVQAPATTSDDDLTGEVVSHDLARGVDPVLTSAYDAFQQSMTPAQLSRLQEQYQWSRDHEGETRPFDVWRKNSGQPAYFRGYLFGQWPDPQDLYTPGQIDQFNKVRGYIRGRP